MSEVEVLNKEIAELKKQILEKDQQIVKSESKAVTFKEKMVEMELFPEIAKMNAMLEYELKMARKFVESKAFPNLTPEQAYVLIKAGKELGLTEMKSLGSLYVVNGNIGFWGSGLVSQLTKNGVKISYINETPNQVTVKVNYNGEVIEETAKDTDQILVKSKAMTYAKKNKMRFHGVRMIASFYLAHLLHGISVWEPDDIEASKELQKGEDYFDLKEMIENAQSLEELDTIMTSNKKILTSPKNIDLLALFGSVKKEFELSYQMDNMGVKELVSA